MDGMGGQWWDRWGGSGDVIGGWGDGLGFRRERMVSERRYRQWSKGLRNHNRE